MKNIFLIEDLTGYLDVIEIPLIIAEIEQEIKSFEEWSNNPETQIKLNLNPINLFNGKTFEQYYKEDLIKIEGLKNSLQYYKNRLTTILN